MKVPLSPSTRTMKLGVADLIGLDERDLVPIAVDRGLVARADRLDDDCVCRLRLRVGLVLLQGGLDVLR